MEEAEQDGYETLEQAARGDIPERFVTILGVRIDGDRAKVWMLTNDRPPYERNEVHCERTASRWQSDIGRGGFGIDAPPQVFARAARLESR